MLPKKEIVAIDAVTKDYAAGKTSPAVHVLSGVSLRVAEGDSISITGPSGSGKSTLLNIMGLLDTPSSGRVRFNGADASGLSDDEASRVRNRKIGFIFQMHYLLPQCTVLENILIPALPLGKKQYDEAYARGITLLKTAGIENRMHHRPAQLSGGEQLRAAVVRALINEPDILLADEPTGSLDRKTAGEISELIISINRDRKRALVIVTHAHELAGRMEQQFELKDGMLKPVR